MEAYHKFVFSNDWIKAKPLPSLQDEFTNLDDSLEMLLPSLVNFASKKSGMSSKSLSRSHDILMPVASQVSEGDAVAAAAIMTCSCLSMQKDLASWHQDM